jgi:hypothetical protein
MISRKLAVALVLAISAAAAEVPLPELRIEPTTGGSIFYIKNVSPAPLTAYLIELVNYPGSYYALWQDDLASEPLAAGAERRLTVANMTVGAVPDYVKMRAALYADGTSAGIPKRVAQLDRAPGQSPHLGYGKSGADRRSQTVGGQYAAGETQPECLAGQH